MCYHVVVSRSESKQMNSVDQKLVLQKQISPQIYKQNFLDNLIYLIVVKKWIKWIGETYKNI